MDTLNTLRSGFREVRASAGAKVRASAVAVCALVSLVSVSCRHNDSTCPLASISVPATHTSSLRVCLSPSPRAEVHSHSDMVFPEQAVAERRVIDGVNYLGVVADGHGDHIELFAARHPSEGGVVMVVVDTSMDLDLEVSFSAAGRSARENVKCIRVQEGRHRFDFEREETGEVRYWETAGNSDEGA